MKNLQNAHTPSLRESQSDSKQSTKTNASAAMDCFGDKSPRNDEHSEPLAQIFHYDLFGKRREKFSFLLSNTLNSVNFSELKPKPPFYLFVPQNDELRGVYEGFWSVKDIFAKSGVGICSKRDEVVFQATKERLKALLHDFATKPKEELRRIYSVGADSGGWKLEWAIDEVKKHENLDEFIAQCHYRPFDMRWTFYTDKNCGFMARPVFDIFQHFLGCENVGLLVSRQESAMGDDTCNPNFVSDKIVDLNYFRVCGVVVMPLYLKTENSHNSQKDENSQGDTKSPPPLRRGVWGVGEKTHENDKNSKNSVNLKANSAQNSQNLQNDNFADAKFTHPQTPSAREGALPLANSTPQGALMVENFTPKFREFIDKKYKQKFSPKQILGYIYAVLYHKAYREKFAIFLGIDYPRIPFCESGEKFLKLSELGQELIDLHLMKADLNDEGLNGVGVAIDSGDDKIISKIAYHADSKEIFVNESLHFKGVEAAVWGYKIGGYAVLDKYLKSHKAPDKAEQKEKLDYAHFERVIKTLHKSLQIEAKIAQISIE